MHQYQVRYRVGSGEDLSGSLWEGRIVAQLVPLKILFGIVCNMQRHLNMHAPRLAV